MKPENRFRNHISVIIERVGAGIWLIVGILFWQFIDDPELLLDNVRTEEGMFWLLLILGVVLAIFGSIFFIQYVIWSKTFISVDGTSIVYERNTLQYKKQTIGIHTISNINTEQNLFEMFLGTCKIKLDTNSMSTADSTDVMIVLKKKDAEDFKNYILSLMNQTADDSLVVDAVKEEDLFGGKEAGGMEQMMIHGLLSIHIITVIIAFSALGGLVGVVRNVLGSGANGIFGYLSGILILLFFAASSTWTIVKGFLQYYGFQVVRKGNRLFIQYGLLKKVNYTIPVDKINAIRLIQSPQARFMKYYTVDLINVGMGDNEQEEKSFFLMYNRAEIIAEQINQLLPEFSDCLDKKMKEQPISVWAVWTLPTVIITAVLGVGLLIVAEFFPEVLTIATVIVIVVLFLDIWVSFFKFRTEGYSLEEEVLGICKGAFRRELVFVKYEKIQYICSKQNFIAKHFHIRKADIFLLASSMNRNHELPYFAESELERLKEKILETEANR